MLMYTTHPGVLQGFNHIPAAALYDKRGSNLTMHVYHFSFM